MEALGQRNGADPDPESFDEETLAVYRAGQRDGREAAERQSRVVLRPPPPPRIRRGADANERMARRAIASWAEEHEHVRGLPLDLPLMSRPSDKLPSALHRKFAQEHAKVLTAALTSDGVAPSWTQEVDLDALIAGEAPRAKLGQLLRVAATAVQCGPDASETLRTLFEGVGAEKRSLLSAEHPIGDEAFEEVLASAARPTVRIPACPLGDTDKPIEVGVLVHGKVYELANVRKHHATHQGDEGGALLDGKPLPAELPLVNPMTGKPLAAGTAAAMVPLVVPDVVKSADGSGALLSNGKKAHFTLDDEGAFECPVLFDAPEHCVLASDFGVYGEDAWKQLMTTGGPRGGAPRSLYDNETLLAEKAHRIPVGKKGVEALEAALLAGDEMDCKAPRRGAGWSDGLDADRAQAAAGDDLALQAQLLSGADRR
jgi:hypothetical protein